MYIKKIAFLKFIGSLSLSGILIPLYFLIDYIDQLNRETLLYFFVVLYIASKISFIIIKNEYKILQLTFYIFNYVFFGLIPLIQTTTNKYYWFGYYDNQKYFSAFLIIITGLVAYDIGISMSYRKKERKKLVNLDNNYEFNFKNFLLLFILSIVLTLLSLYALGGINALFNTRENLSNTIDGPMSNIVTSFLRIPLYIFLILCFTSIFSNKKNNNQKTIYLITFIALILNLIVSNPVSTARFWFGTVMFTIILIFAPRFKISLTKLFYFILTILLVVFPYSDLFRRGLEINLEENSIFVSGDFDAYQQLLNTLRFVDIDSYAFGKQLIGTVLFYIPRSVWEGKPIGTGQLIAEKLNYSYTNLSAPIYSEAYIDFGIIGIIIAFFLYGLFSGDLEKKYVISLKNSLFNMYLIIVPSIAAYQFFLLRGQFISTVPPLIVVFVLTKVYSNVVLKKKNLRGY